MMTILLSQGGAYVSHSHGAVRRPRRFLPSWGVLTTPPLCSFSATGVMPQGTWTFAGGPL